MSEETKAKISAAHKGIKKPWLKGNTYRAKWLETHNPPVVTDEIRAKMSAALKGIPRPWLKGNRFRADWAERIKKGSDD
jgi:hypothetical protein